MMHTYRSVTICSHQLPQGCVLFDLKMNHTAILPCHFQVDVFTFRLTILNLKQLTAHMTKSCMSF